MIKKMKFFFFTIVVLACISSTLAFTKCPRVPTLDIEKVNLDQVDK